MSRLSGKTLEERHMFMLEKSDSTIMKTAQRMHTALDLELSLLFSAPCVQQVFPSHGTITTGVLSVWFCHIDLLWPGATKQEREGTWRKAGPLVSLCAHVLPACRVLVEGQSRLTLQTSVTSCMTWGWWHHLSQPVVKIKREFTDSALGNTHLRSHYSVWPWT